MNKILLILLKAAQNKIIWLRFVVLVSVFFIGAILFSRTKTDSKGSETCEKQRGELIQALIDIRRELEPAKAVSLSARPDAFIYAIFDTVPKRQQQQVQQRQVQKVVSKIDSLLLKYKQKSKS